MADIEKMSKEQLVQNVKRNKLSMKRATEYGKHVGSNLAMTAIAGGTAFGSGMLYEKFGDKITYFGSSDIRTDLVFGSAFALYGVFGMGAMSGASLALGLGLLLPWASDQGRVVAQKIK